MQIQVQTESLRDAFGKILSVVDKKHSRPILTCTQVVAKAGKIECIATDLEVSAKIILDAQVIEEGTFCVNSKNLFDILRELPDGNIILKMSPTDNSLKILFKDINFSLLVYKSDEFPHLSFENQYNQFQLAGSQLLEMIHKTHHAISTDETRLYLNGIYLQEIESKLRAVATDGHRLALIETKLEGKQIDSLINGVIIPKKGVSELKKISEAYADKTITVSVDETFMFVNAENKYFLSIRLIAREYPKYQAVIPQKTTFKLIAERDAFLTAIKRISIMSNEKSHGVRVKINDQEMIITAHNKDLGEATEKLSVDYSGKEMEIGFNARYLMDALSTFDSGEVVFELNNELSPVIVKSETEPHYLGIIMPLKL
jgi:DNA polymerase III subunit beta